MVKKCRTASGEAREVSIRCGTRFRRRCPSCAHLYRGDVRAVMYDGLNVIRDAAEGVGDALFFLTFTAPSFGRTHRAAKGYEKGGRRCGCGRRHEPGSAWRGVPLRFSEYDYVSQVPWNYCAGRLLSRTMDEVGRLLELDGRPTYITVAEYQQRGAIHFHTLLRVNRHLVPQIKAAVLKATEATKVYAGAGTTGDKIGRGEQIDVKHVEMKTGAEAYKTAGYLAKLVGYSAKDLGRDLLDESAAADALGVAERARAVHVGFMRGAVSDAMYGLDDVGGLPAPKKVGESRQFATPAADLLDGPPSAIWAQVRKSVEGLRAHAVEVGRRDLVPMPSVDALGGLDDATLGASAGVAPWDRESVPPGRDGAGPGQGVLVEVIRDRGLRYDLVDQDVADDVAAVPAEDVGEVAHPAATGRVLEQWGWRGHVVRKSRRWGMTMTECRERRRRHAAEQRETMGCVEAVEWLPGTRVMERTEWEDLIAAASAAVPRPHG
ncbi:replication initiator [Isoptericola halotolerans]|uniref:replication initiator n=1 Tax=Isoptericola halotolerans TaxID=300560 RepID=UPI0031B5D075